LTGIEKASVLLMSLDSEASEEILKRLSPEERDLIDAQIVRMRSVESVVRDRVLEEAREVVRSGGPNESEAFKWLETRDSDAVVRLLAGERPRTIALVLSHLSPSAVVSVLVRLDEKTRERVTRSLASGPAAAQDVMKTVDETLRRRAAGAANEPGADEPPSILKALGDATAKARESVLTAISGAHRPETPSPGREVSSLENLPQLPDWRIRAVLGGADLDDLCLALRVASDELKSAVMRNIPAATAALLRERLQKAAHVRIREIEIAQQRVLGAVLRACQPEALVEAAVE